MNIRDHEHITWWRPDSRGYTICTHKAGVYTELEARSICTPAGGTCIAVPKDEATKLACTTPYYRRLNGYLAKLYDGDQHAPVPNSSAAWRALDAARLDTGRMDKPTPMAASRSRAIYLPASLQPNEGSAA
ncbi:hypothetical protein CXB49_09715 [Chromobacterium sp. ATCC 53434]|nr:hypothetical protein CXB49_09715 [Chromobacterium sp. ATCC 53434]